MSKEAVAAFLEEIPRDPDLQKEIVALAAKHGHDFTTDELNDADLDAIAGGFDLDEIIEIPTVSKKKKPAKK